MQWFIREHVCVCSEHVYPRALQSLTVMMCEAGLTDWTVYSRCIMYKRSYLLVWTMPHQISVLKKNSLDQL